MTETTSPDRPGDAGTPPVAVAGRRRCRRPSPALVVASLALVVAMGGSAVAAVAGLQSGDTLIAKHTLSGNRLRNHTVTGRQIDLRHLPTVPRAASVPPLVWHPLTLINNWANYNVTLRPPAYAVDVQGIVHLRGAIYETVTTSAQFSVLPPPLHPSATLWLTADTFAASTGRIYITTDGAMTTQDGASTGSAASFTSLDGITFAKG